MKELQSRRRRALLQGMAAASLMPAVALPGGAAVADAAKSSASPAAATKRLIPGSAEALPVIGLGTWQSLDVVDVPEVAEARETLRLFAANGASVVDSSPMYGRAESVVGRLSQELHLAGQLFLATKVWTTGRAAGIAQMEQSARRMATRRLDLMQIHNLVDADTHAVTLRDWKNEGRIRYWGVSHYHSGAYAAVESFLRAQRPDFLQINYSLAEPEAAARLLPLARDLGIAVIANRPFAHGDLFQRVQGRPLPGWAADFDAASWAQFFLKWIVADPAVTCVIPATRNPKYLLDNLAAGRGGLPDAATRTRMAALLRG